jgi:hypothetical protein
MADSIETIKAGMTAPTHEIVNGERVDLTEAEANSILDEWAENERARQLDVEANGYKVARQSAYPPIAEQLDKLYHDINNGTLDNTGEFFTALNTVKTDNPKPSE